MGAGRRRARREALFVLYQGDLMGLEPQAALERAERAGAPTDPYTKTLVLGVGARKAEIDQIISRHLVDWTLDRLAPLERNVLRLAVNELLWEDEMPAAVAIDEAVELAKRFASDEAGALVNGVLGAIALAHPGAVEGSNPGS